MKLYRKITSGISFIQRYHYRWVVVIAISWTVIDLLYWLYTVQSPRTRSYLDAYDELSAGAVVLRAAIVLVMSGVMGYVLIFWLRQAFRDLPLLVNLFAKTCVLFVACVFMNFLLHFSWDVVGRDMSAMAAIRRFFSESGSFRWLAEHSLGWVCLFVLTQIAIEFYEKYSPGVFWNILIGRYIQPKSEVRIVMFLDLVDSTAIAEKLDSKLYFSFIRDFIYWVSIAMLEYNGRIYQYVGDEIVVSWLKKPRNVDKCLKALQLADRLLRKSKGYFIRRYGFVPEFKAGIHAGQVTMGEIGIIKKDIAISGDTMNTAARIRTACTELNCMCLVSKDVVEGLILGWDKEYLGAVELRGKTESIELYCLKI